MIPRDFRGVGTYPVSCVLWPLAQAHPELSEVMAGEGGHGAQTPLEEVFHC